LSSCAGVGGDLVCLKRHGVGHIARGSAN
jgi:hypothetical protein